MSDGRSTTRASRVVGYVWLVPAALCLWFILARGSVAPYWDQFAIGEFLARAFERGYPTWSELFAQHNESRKLFPRLLFWALAWPGVWDVRREMVAHWVLLVVGGLALTSLARRTLPAWPGAVAAAMGGTLLFSISQWQNLLWGIQIITSVPTVMLLVGMWALMGPGEGLTAGRYVARVLVGVGAAVVATYSYANGMALWVLLVPVVLLAPAPSAGWRWGGVAVMGMVGVASLVGYFATYARPGSHPPMDVAASHPAAAAMYFAAFLGNGLRVGSGHEVAIGIGGLLLLLAVLGTAALYGAAVVRRSLVPLREGLPWLTLMAYAMLSAAATTAGRLAFGLPTAVSERYVTFALPMVVGLLPVMYLTCRHVFPSRPHWGAMGGAMAMAAGCGSLLTLHVLASAQALGESRRFAEDRRQGLVAAIWLDVCPNEPEARTLLYPVPNEARLILRRLAGLGRLAFPLAGSDRASAYAAGDGAERGGETGGGLGGVLGHVDHVGREGDVLTLTGWAVSPGDPGRSADGVLLGVELAGQGGGVGDARLVAMTARVSGYRPDVPANAGRRYTARAGWSMTVDLRYTPIAEGSRLSVWVYDRASHSLRRLNGEVVRLPGG